MSQKGEVVTMIWRFQRGHNMRGPRLRTTIKSVVAILCAACFLTMSLGSVSRAIAADTWETWPKKTIETDTWETWPKNPNPETDANGSGRAGDAAEKKTEKGIFSGKKWWVAVGVAVAIGIAIAAGSSGGGDGGGTSTNPGHH